MATDIRDVKWTSILNDPQTTFGEIHMYESRTETRDSLKAEVLHQLGLALEENPDKRIGEIILDASFYVGEMSVNVTDEKLLEGLKAFSA